MKQEEIMTVPRLSADEYSSIVTDWNRRVRRGMVERCARHEWARLPSDTDQHPDMICVHCMRSYRPDPRLATPVRGRGRPL